MVDPLRGRWVIRRHDPEDRRCRFQIRSRFRSTRSLIAYKPADSGVMSVSEFAGPPDACCCRLLLDSVHCAGDSSRAADPRFPAFPRSRTKVLAPCGTDYRSDGEKDLGSSAGSKPAAALSAAHRVHYPTVRPT